MPPPTSAFLGHAKSIAFGTSMALSLCCYVAYRSHDLRVLTTDEVDAARDVVAQITPSLGSSVESSQARHLENLNKLGVTVVNDILSKAQLKDWNTRTKEAFNNADGKQNIVWNSGRSHCSISKRSLYYNDMAQIGSEVDGNAAANDDDSKKYSTRSPRWIRKWFKRNGTSEIHSSSNGTMPLQITLQQIVSSYFQTHNISRYELTDVQFLNANPNKSTNQIWHRDNKFRGLTAIVALKDVRDNGPTELILGSHLAEYSLMSSFGMFFGSYLPSFLRDSTSGEGEMVPIKPLLACINAGDAVLYDARIFHRGRANNCMPGKSEGRDRPVLVLRWDAARTPPPGAGLIVTTANIYSGKVLYAGLYLLEKLQSSDSSGTD